MKKKSIKDSSIVFSRTIVEELNWFFKVPIEKNLRFEIVGSYRRGLEKIGDIDIIAKIDDAYWWHWYVGKIGGEPWVIGQRMLDFSLNNIPINIRFFSSNEWGAGLLYFTGSKEFNIFCRKRARDLGMSLNQYDLFLDGNPLNLGKKEEYILEKLGLLEYLDPAKRSICLFATQS